MKQQELYFIFIITLFHFFLLNGLEKAVFETVYDVQDIPPKYFEIISMLSIWLALKHGLSWFVPFAFLFGFAFFSTPYQLVVGFLLGAFYSALYVSLNSWVLYLTACIGFYFIFGIITVWRIETLLDAPVPFWVDPGMYDSMRKKRTVPLLQKLVEICVKSSGERMTFMSWHRLEMYLDKIVFDVQNSGIHYDAVVGLKTGGAILSDYIGMKLDIPVYKIKVSSPDNHCNKQPHHAIRDILKKIVGDARRYDICEGIKADLNGKRLLLIDETLGTGKTMHEGITYLNQVKGASFVKAVTVAKCFSYSSLTEGVQVVLNKRVSVWPWGYDN